jgi:MFS family permease
VSPIADAWRDYRDAARAFSPAARAFLLATLFSWTGFGVNQVLFNLYLVEGGYRESFVGHAVSMTGFGLALAALPSGWLADHWGRRRCLVTGGVIDGIALATRALTVHPAALLATSFIAGFGQSMIAISAAPYITDHSTPRERTHLFSAFFSFQLLAGVFGSLLGGWLPHGLLALAGAGFTKFIAYRTTLVAGAVIEVLSVIPLLALHAPKEPPVVRAPIASDPQGVRMVTRIALFAFLLGAGAGLVIPFMNLYFKTRFGCSSAQIGVFFSLAQVTTAVAALIGPAVARRYGRLRTAVGSQLMSIPFMVTLGFESRLGVAVGAFWLRATLMQASMPLLTAFIMEAMPHNLRARATSVLNLLWNIGWAVSATLAGGVIQSFGYAVPFTVTGALYLAATASFWFSFRHMRETGPPAPEALAAEAAHPPE